MALFSGSSSDSRRPLGPRPFSGKENSAKSPVLRPHGLIRRNTAAPFAAVQDSEPKVEAPDAGALESAVAVESQAPGVDSAPPDTVDEHNLAAMVSEPPPSILQYDDIRSEAPTWVSAPEASYIEVHDTVAGVDSSSFEAAIDALGPLEDPEGDRPGHMEYEAPTMRSLGATELPLPPSAGLPDDSVEQSGGVGSTLEGESPAGAKGATDLEAGFAEVPGGPEWEALYSAAEKPESAPRVEDVEATEGESIGTAHEADDHEDYAASSMPWDATEAPAPSHSQPEGAGLGDDDRFMIAHLDESDARSPEGTDPAGGEVAPGPELESTVDLVQAGAGESVAAVPDEAWWPADPYRREEEPGPTLEVVNLMSVEVPAMAIDGSAALDALVSETTGAERAVEVLETVARMVRSREIVVSVGAGATAESVLASILASLLTHPS